MKIGQKRTQGGGSRLGILAVVLLFFLIGLTIGNPNWGEAVLTAVSNPRNLLAFLQPPADLPTLTVDMPFANFDQILQQRQTAVSQGVFIGSEDDFVNADIRLSDGNGETAVPVRMRLQQGPAVGLAEDGKWPFDVRTRQDSLLLGMSRFSLQDPASNNWLNQWLFAKSLEQAGLLTTRYQFVRLVFNGDDRGIYALQSGFGDELMSSQGRELGVMVAFDGTRLWQAMAQHGGSLEAALADPALNLSSDDYQFFEVDTFRDRAVARDELRSAQKDNAIGLLRGLQAGELTAAAVFDVAAYGAFLAHVDLWGATEAVSLLNLRYYFDPTNGRLSPIAHSANPLSDANARLEPIHFYNDPAIQAAYVQTAVQLADPAYVDQLEANFGAELIALRRVLEAEAALTAPWEALRARQSLLQATLNPLQPTFAYLGPPSLAMQAIIQVDVANTLNLPLELLGFDIGGVILLEPEPSWLQGDASALLVDGGENGRFILKSVPPNAGPRYLRFHLPLTALLPVQDQLDFLREFDIQVVTRLYGRRDGDLRAVARPGYPPPT